MVLENDKPSIFVSHVSPGKEPLLVRLMTHLNPSLWVSGHMGGAYSSIWNPLATCEENEVIEWLANALPQIEGLSLSLSTNEFGGRLS